MDGRLSARKAFERGAVHEEDVELPVAVEIEEGHAGPRGLQEVAVGVLAPEHRDHVEACLRGDLGEGEAQAALVSGRGGGEARHGGGEDDKQRRPARPSPGVAPDRHQGMVLDSPMPP